MAEYDSCLDQEVIDMEGLREHSYRGGCWGNQGTAGAAAGDSGATKGLVLLVLVLVLGLVLVILVQPRDWFCWCWCW